MSGGNILLGENEVISEEMMGMLNGLDEKEANLVEDARFRAKSDAKLMKNKGFCTNSLDSEESFWRKVKKSEGCWLWTGPRGLDGKVGVCWVFMDGRRTYMTAHRYMWILKVVEIPDDAVVKQTAIEARGEK